MHKLFIFFQYCLPQHLLSRLTGALADCQLVLVKNFLIRLFIRYYKVNMEEAQRQHAEDYVCFNDFFTRQLREGARPLSKLANAVISPVDGSVSAAGKIDQDQIFQAKGKSFSLQALLGGDAEMAALFRQGNFATLYLAPRDYHRIHMPFAGSLQKMTYVPGKLFSVNQNTADNIDELFARNERAVCLFQTAIGPMAVILVGALIVAGIETSWHGQVAPAKQKFTESYSADSAVELGRGEEMGLFKLGSTVILLFPEESIHWSDGLQKGASVRLGQSIGNV